MTGKIVAGEAPDREAGEVHPHLLPSPATTSRDLDRYVGMYLAAVTTNRAGDTVLAFRRDNGTPQSRGWHWVAIPTTSIRTWIGKDPNKPVTMRHPVDRDWLQQEIDIGDDMYDRDHPGFRDL